MTTALSPGANAPLPTTARTIAVRLQAASGHADLIALLLDEGGRADGDNGVVLYSQLEAAGGAVSLDLASDTATVSIATLPPAVERVLIVAQADGSSDVTPCGTLTATVTADGTEVATAAFSALPSVATLQLVEIYRRGGAWKVRALGDGYAEGLAKLLTVHGVEVNDEPPAAPAAPAPAPARPAASAAPPGSASRGPSIVGSPLGNTPPRPAPAASPLVGRPLTTSPPAPAAPARSSIVGAPLTGNPPPPRRRNG